VQYCRSWSNLDESKALGVTERGRQARTPGHVEGVDSKAKSEVIVPRLHQSCESPRQPLRLPVDRFCRLRRSPRNRAARSKLSYKS
jgi:hypothetical protein